MDALPDSPKTLQRTVSLESETVVLPVRYDCNNFFFAVITSTLITLILIGLPAIWSRNLMGLRWEDLLDKGLETLTLIPFICISSLLLGMVSEEALAMFPPRTYNTSKTRQGAWGLIIGFLGHLLFGGIAFGWMFPLLKDLGLHPILVLVPWSVGLPVILIGSGLWSRRQGQFIIDHNQFHWVSGWRLGRFKTRKQWTLSHRLVCDTRANTRLHINDEGLPGTEGLTESERSWLEAWMTYQFSVKTTELGVPQSPPSIEEIPEALEALRSHQEDSPKT